MSINDSQSVSSGELTEELSLQEIIKFIQEFWKTIVGFTLIGILGASLFLWVIPKQYEASTQIKMAQIANINNNNNNNINPLGINIEEPQALIYRMALPTTYTKEVISLCGLANQKDSNAIIIDKVRMSIPRGVNGIVDLKVRDTSKEVAKSCANAVYQFIKESQGKLIAPFIQEAQEKLILEEERLKRATELIAKADKSSATVSAAYLATRDEIRYLLDQISNLQTLITTNESRSTLLIADVYVNSNPIYPKNNIVLVAGLFLGCLSGLFFALLQKTNRSNLSKK